MTSDSDAFGADAIASGLRPCSATAARSSAGFNDLAAAALAIDDRRLPRIAGARDAIGRLVIELTYREPGEQRRAKAAVLRVRWCQQR